MSENKDANERLFADVEKLVDAAVAREDITIQQGADISQALWHCLVGQPQPPVPTGSVEVTREHREAAYKAAYGDEPPDDGDDEWVATGLYRGAALTGERLGAPNQANAFAQLFATREAPAHQVGLESAQGGWVAVEERLPEPADDEPDVEACGHRVGTCEGECRRADTEPAPALEEYSSEDATIDGWECTRCSDGNSWADRGCYRIELDRDVLSWNERSYGYEGCAGSGAVPMSALSWLMRLEDK